MTHDWRKIAHTLITQPEGRPWKGGRDFRHFFSWRLQKPGVHPKLLSALMGHSKVNLAMDVYDQADEQDLRGALLHAVTRREEAA